MQQGFGWPLVSDDANGVEQTQLVAGVAYGQGQAGVVGLAAANQPGGAAVAAPSLLAPAQSFNTTGIIPVQFNVQLPLYINVNPLQSILGANPARAVLVLENLSLATVAGDVAPTLYVGFGSPPIIGAAFGILPGVGLWLDRAVPTDAIFVGWGGLVNTSGSVVTQGWVGSASIIAS